jgi:hypothetical protein
MLALLLRCECLLLLLLLLLFVGAAGTAAGPDAVLDDALGVVEPLMAKQWLNAARHTHCRLAADTKHSRGSVTVKPCTINCLKADAMIERSLGRLGAG